MSVFVAARDCASTARHVRQTAGACPAVAGVSRIAAEMLLFNNIILYMFRGCWRDTGCVVLHLTGILPGTCMFDVGLFLSHRVFFGFASGRKDGVDGREGSEITYSSSMHYLGGGHML